MFRSTGTSNKAGGGGGGADVISLVVHRKHEQRRDNFREIALFKRSVSDLRQRERSRLVPAQKLLSKKQVLQNVHRSLTEECGDLTNRGQELTCMRDDTTAQVQRMKIEIDQLTVQSDELREETLRYLKDDVELRAEIDQLHLYDSKMAVVTYEMREHLNREKGELRHLERDTEKAKTECRDFDYALNHPENIAEGAHRIKQDCRNIEGENEDLGAQIDGLRERNEQIRKEIERSLRERSSLSRNGPLVMVGRFIQGVVSPQVLPHDHAQPPTGGDVEHGDGEQRPRHGSANDNGTIKRNSMKTMMTIAESAAAGEEATS